MNEFVCCNSSDCCCSDYAIVSKFSAKIYDSKAYCYIRRAERTKKAFNIGRIIFLIVLIVSMSCPVFADEVVFSEDVGSPVNMYSVLATSEVTNSPVPDISETVSDVQEDKLDVIISYLRSIYAFIAFFFIMISVGFVIYLILKPILYFI